MKNCLTLLALSFVVTQLFSQSINGTISGPGGNPISYATIYIEELKQGTVANDEGYFAITVPPGRFKLTFQSLGFTHEVRIIEVGEKEVHIDIVLQIQYYTVPEVKVMASGEDPAYSIMRKAIGLAPYHLNRVKSYKADVYLKGNLVMTNIPRVMRKSFRINDTQIKAGDRFIMESYNSIEFQAPDKYVQRVISQRTNFPSAGNSISPMDFIKSSFYQPNIGSMTISPLSPDALSHYRFEYLGATKEGEFLVNKVEVTPKRKSQQLWSGTIYIVEDLWCIHSLALSNESIAGVISVEQIYTPVDQGIWLPVTHQFDIDVSMLGVKGFAGYGGSVKYLAVTPDAALPVPESVTLYMNTSASSVTEIAPPKKANAEIETLLAKNDLSNRDMARLGKLMEKEVAAINPKEKEELQIIDKTTYIIEDDATRKDSTFWASIRPIPLSRDDKPIVIHSDTSGILAPQVKQGLTIAVGTSAQSDTLKKKKAVTMMHIMRGKTWRTEDGFRFGMDGVAKLNRSGYNPVDGFYYGTGFRISKDWDKATLAFYPTIGYYFGREAFTWNVNSTFSFNRKMQEQIYLRSGTLSKDLNQSGGINSMVNSFTSLFLKQNYLKLYESDYITVGHSIEAFNGFYIGIEGTYEDRINLINNSNFSFLYKNRAFDPNFPDNKYVTDGFPPEGSKLFATHETYLSELKLTYIPRQRYRIIDNRKIPAGSDYPTFTTQWTHGHNFDAVSLGNWDHISGSVSYRSNTGTFVSYTAMVRGGGFINPENLRFQDFKHVNNQPLPLNLGVPEDAFMLMPFYSMSTPGSYLEFHGKYTNPYILLKLLPGLSNTLIRENLSFSLFKTDRSELYSEIGYSLSELFFLGELGLYTGFTGTAYHGTGVRLSLRFN